MATAGDVDAMINHHEAGHAVVAAALNLPLEKVTRAVDMPPALGYAALSVPFWRFNMGHILVFALAGPAAGRRYGGTAYHLDYDHGDLEIVRPIISACVGSAALTLPRRSGRTPPPLDVQCARALTVWARRAEHVVAAHWPWIRAVADQLAAQETLLARHVHQLRPSEGRDSSC